MLGGARAHFLAVVRTDAAEKMDMSCFPRWRRSGLIVAVTALGLGCTGGIDGSPARPGAPSGPGGPSAPGGMSSPGGGPAANPPPLGGGSGCKTLDPGPSPMRRLTNLEYVNTVTDLFGAQVAGALTFIPEARVDGFDNSAEGRSVSNAPGAEYYAAAEKLAGRGHREPGDAAALRSRRRGRGHLPGPVPGRLRQARLAPAAGAGRAGQPEAGVRRRARQRGSFADGIAAGHPGDADVAAVPVPDRARRGGRRRRTTCG